VKKIEKVTFTENGKKKRQEDNGAGKPKRARRKDAMMA
jgi:hypothetical protein